MEKFTQYMGTPPALEGRQPQYRQEPPRITQDGVIGNISPQTRLMDHAQTEMEDNVVTSKSNSKKNTDGNIIESPTQTNSSHHDTTTYKELCNKGE